jgi:hypothetical protein
MILELEHLVDTATYCVIRDEDNRESVMASGRRIKAQALTCSDFKRFKPFQMVSLAGYLRLRVNDEVHLGIWRDPSRPELQADGGKPPLTVAIVNAVPKTRTVADTLYGCRDLINRWAMQS